MRRSCSWVVCWQSGVEPTPLAALRYREQTTSTSPTYYSTDKRHYNEHRRWELNRIKERLDALRVEYKHIYLTFARKKLFASDLTRINGSCKILFCAARTVTARPFGGSALYSMSIYQAMRVLGMWAVFVPQLFKVVNCELELAPPQGCEMCVCVCIHVHVVYMLERKKWNEINDREKTEKQTHEKKTRRFRWIEKMKKLFKVCFMVVQSI